MIHLLRVRYGVSKNGGGPIIAQESLVCVCVCVYALCVDCKGVLKRFFFVSLFVFLLSTLRRPYILGHCPRPARSKFVSWVRLESNCSGVVCFFFYYYCTYLLPRVTIVPRFRLSRVDVDSRQVEVFFIFFIFNFLILATGYGFCFALGTFFVPFYLVPGRAR